MKTNAIVRIVLYSIVILLLLSILGGFLAYDRYAFKTHGASWAAPVVTIGSGEFHQEEHEVAGTEPVTHIEIEWTAGTITIQPGDTDQVTFSERGSIEPDDQMVYSQSGNKLTIRYQKQQVRIGIQNVVSKDLIITVPRDWMGDSIEIDAASARLELRDITVRELEFDGASGTGSFENCTIEELDIDTASGDIEYSGTLNTLDFDAMSAKLTARLSNHPRSMELDTMSGDVDLTLPADCGFTVRIETASSDFSTDFETSTQKGKHVHGDGSCRIEISGMSGDVHIRKGS